MIMTVSELKQFLQSDESDQVLEAKLQALELLIRSYTHNNFQVRSFRAVAKPSTEHLLKIEDGASLPWKLGDTLQISESDLQQDMLITIQGINSDSTIFVKEDLFPEGKPFMITKVVYPTDVKMGVVNLMKWELENRDKVGISSETISRHSVTYFNMDQGNSTMGFPSSLLGFLKPYKKARFGGGL